MNAINVISPYKHYGMWVFDDARVGLLQEPFEAGAAIMIECLVADIPNEANGFVLIFAGAPFPGASFSLFALAASLAWHIGISVLRLLALFGCAPI